MLFDIAVADCLNTPYRFFVIYILSNPILSPEAFVCLVCKELKALLSVVFLYKSAFWLERETWDLYGIYFINNSDLRKLLTNYGSKSYPLKKTYPLTGFNEVQYSQLSKKLQNDEVKTNQQFRKLKQMFC